MSSIVIAGLEVATLVQASRTNMNIARNLFTHPSQRDEVLCSWQVAMSKAGICEAEMVRSMYGWSLRHASGTMNFGLIRAADRNSADNGWASCVEFALKWVATAPDRRYVTIGGYDLQKYLEE